MPVNSKGQKYTISDNGRNRLHVYGTPGKKGVRFASKDYRVVKMARPKGYSYNPKNTQYYKTTESNGGLTATNTYQDGHKVNMPGSAWKKSGLPGSDYQQALNTWNITNQPTIDKLTLNKTREGQAQNRAYGTIAGYYAGLQGQTQGLMNQVGQVGQATDAQVKSIGADRNAQIQQATPQYGGPLGMVAQRMADTEQQAALNRGAGVDSANRTYGVQTSGSRQALLGQLGAGQAVAGQERLSLLKGQGNQALQSYTDKINEIEGQKGAKVLDTARQLGYDRKALGLKQAAAAADLYRAQHPPARGRGGGGGGGGSRGGGKGKGKSAKPKAPKINTASNRNFWGKVDRIWKTKATYDEIRNDPKGGEAIANVVRALRESNGKSITPYANSVLTRDGFSSSGYYPVAKVFGERLADAFGNPLGNPKR
jgi:hypothetical protein